MAENIPSLASYYMGWEVYQELLTTSITPLSPDELALRAAPHLRSVGVLAGHIIAARIWWFHNVMGEGSAELAPLEKWDEDDQPALTAAELVSGLEQSWQVIQSGLERWTPADLAQTFPHPRPGRKETYSRQWIVWHILEHDLHHGGELSFTLGMHGVAAMDL